MSRAASTQKKNARGPRTRTKTHTDERTFRHTCVKMGAGSKGICGKTHTHTHTSTSAHVPFGFPRARMLVTGLISGPRELLINLSFWLSI